MIKTFISLDEGFNCGQGALAQRLCMHTAHTYSYEYYELFAHTLIAPMHACNMVTSDN